MQDTSPENKLRLLMIYATVYPEKFEGDKGVKLMQVLLFCVVFFLGVKEHYWICNTNFYISVITSLLDCHQWI